MRIITRYLLTSFLGPFATCLVAFNLLYFLFDLFENFSKFIDARLPWHGILRYYGGMMSAYSAWFVPASLMLATLYTMWKLSRNSEISAMRSSGIGFVHLSAPFLAVALLMTALTAANYELVAPSASAWSFAMQQKKFRIEGAMDHTLYYKDRGTHRFWRTDAPVRMDSEASLGIITNVVIEQEHPDGTAAWALSAPKAEYLDGGWYFTDPSFKDYDAYGDATPRTPALPRHSLLRMPFTETPHDLLLAHPLRKWEQYALRDMFRKVNPVYAPSEWFDIYYRIVSPWACVILVLFAIPTGLTTSRQSMMKGILIALAVFFGFFLTTFVGAFLGRLGHVPPPLAAAAPSAAWLAAAVWSFRRMT